MLRHFRKIVHDYQKARVYSFLNSDNPAERQAKHVPDLSRDGRLCIGRSRWQGIRQYSRRAVVPEAQNDMILALIGEQFGFFGTAALSGCLHRVVRRRHRDLRCHAGAFARLVAVGIVAVLATQTFINLLVASGLMPVTGITLPFVSYGGSSLVASFMAAGLTSQRGSEPAPCNGPGIV